jgi:hypothetical protein
MHHPFKNIAHSLLLVLLSLTLLSSCASGHNRLILYESSILDFGDVLNSSSEC